MEAIDPQLVREEGPHVEWRESHDAKDLLDAVCAFANDLADSKKPACSRDMACASRSSTVIRSAT